MLGFSMAQLLVLDQRCGPWDAVVTSWQITQGNKITLLLLGLVVSAISVIAFIVGVLAALRWIDIHDGRCCSFRVLGTGRCVFVA